VKSFLSTIFLALLLVGCAPQLVEIEKGISAVAATTVSPKAVIIAGNAFDALEATAAKYLRFCKVNRASVACVGYHSARAKLRPAMLAGRRARNDLEDFLATHPGELGSSGLYDALKAASATIRGVIHEYNIQPTVGAPR
jgi:hypothetical protein